MSWIYLSPHFDDVVLSCGGLIWEQTQASETVSIWTVCAGEPPSEPFSSFAESLHTRWEAGDQAVKRRRQEDIAACARISACPRHLAVPDCIYRYTLADEARQFLYDSEDALFGPLHPAEQELVSQLTREFSVSLPADAEMVSPLSLFGHVDHRLTRSAAEGLGRSLWYYADYPYVMKTMDQIESLRQAGWQEILFPVSQAGLTAWQEAVAAHQSQISTFWPDLEAMYAEVREYCEMFGGAILWRPPSSE